MYGAVSIAVPGSRSRFCGSTRETLSVWKRCDHLFPFRMTILQHVLMGVGQKFCCEVVLWKQFKHPNLLQLVGAKKSPSTMMMISEWMEQGTIIDFVVACPGTNRLKLVSVFARGLKQALTDAAFAVGGCCPWAGVPPRLAIGTRGLEKRKPDLRAYHLIAI